MSVDFSSVIPKPPAYRSELWVVDSKTGNKGFVAGLEVRVDAAGCRVTRTAPILGYMTGWPGAKVERYCKTRKWSVKRYG